MSIFRYRWFNSLTIALAVSLALLPAQVLVKGGNILWEMLAVVWLVALVGSSLAFLKLSRPLILATQAAVALIYIAWRGIVLATPAGPWFTSLRQLGSQGLDSIRRATPPLDATPGLLWLLLLLTVLIIVVAELLINGLEQPAWSIAPFCLAFIIAGIAHRSDLHWLYLVPVIIAYLIILGTTTSVGVDSTGGHRIAAAGAQLTLSGIIGILALVTALVVAPLVPSNPKQAWTSDASDGPIKLSDPTISLNNDLRRPVNSPILTYTSSNGEPLYLRTVALSSIATEGAQLTPMQLSRFGLAGAYNFPGNRTAVSIKMAQVSSEYLPAPFAIDSFDAAGGWSYDPVTLSVVASGNRRSEQTMGLSYSVVSTVPSPSKEELAAAAAGKDTDPLTTALPEGMSPEVENLTRQVTSQSPTAGAKALAIQHFLRSDNFKYSLAAPTSTSSDTVSAFLLENQTGYCVHFATAMVVMARISGIPARIAVGFAPGEKQPDGSYLVTAHDAHAWPELFFEGIGWVPFEPTPTMRGSAAYTDPATSPEPSPSPSPTSASAQPSGSSSTQPATATPSAAAETAAGEGATGTSFGLPRTLNWLAALVLLAACPAISRQILRGLRLRNRKNPQAFAEGVWSETKALLVDHGYDPLRGSPSLAIQPITGFLSAEASAVLRRIALTVEQSRYAKDGAPVDALKAQTKALNSALQQPLKPKQRALITLLPPSIVAQLKALLWQRRRQA